MGIVLVSHGLAEHAGRYGAFAYRLAADGFHVYAHDHRGHGRTSAPDAPLGRFAERDGHRVAVEDMLAVRQMAVGRHPGLPVIQFGHSMGGLLALAFAETHPDKIDALAVWNSNFHVGLAGRAAQVILRAERMLKGSDVPSGLLPRLTSSAWAKVTGSVGGAAASSLVDGPAALRIMTRIMPAAATPQAHQGDGRPLWRVL